MVRAENASTETAKFLGHGVCDSFSRSTNLTSSTNDANVILREVSQLLRQLKGESHFLFCKVFMLTVKLHNTLYLILQIGISNNRKKLFFKTIIVYLNSYKILTIILLIIIVDVRDLRGVGIQVTKLDPTGSSKRDEKSHSSKSILDFVKKIGNEEYSKPGNFLSLLCCDCENK